MLVSSPKGDQLFVAREHGRKLALRHHALIIKDGHVARAEHLVRVVLEQNALDHLDCVCLGFVMQDLYIYIFVCLCVCVRVCVCVCVRRARACYTCVYI